MFDSVSFDIRSFDSNSFYFGIDGLIGAGKTPVFLRLKDNTYIVNHGSYTNLKIKGSYNIANIPDAIIRLPVNFGHIVQSGKPDNSLKLSADVIVKSKSENNINFQNDTIDAQKQTKTDIKIKSDNTVKL